MKGFATLFWLEARRSWVWAVSLLGSLAFWAWGIEQVRLVQVGERLGLRGSLLSAASMLGALVLVLMIGRIRSETRGGQFQVLLVSPPSGYVHIAARYAFAAATAIIYYVAIGFLFWWIAEKAGIHLDAASAAQMTLGLPLYLMVLTVLPLLAWTLLLMVFVGAYRLSGPGWIPGTAMVLGTAFSMRYLIEGLARISYQLPGWRIFQNLQVLLDRAAWEADVAGYQGYIAMPQEPFWVMLALTLVLLALAGTIWQEVEG
jgi:hypothetical protein